MADGVKVPIDLEVGEIKVDPGKVKKGAKKVADAMTQELAKTETGLEGLSRSIRLSLSGAENDVKALTKQLHELETLAKTLQSFGAVAVPGNGLHTALKDMEILKRRIAELNNQNPDDAPKTQALLAAEKKTEAAKAKLQALADKSKRMNELGATDNAWAALRYDTQLAAENLDKCVAEMRSLVREGKAFEGNPTAEQTKEIQAQLKGYSNFRGALAGKRGAASLGGIIGGNIDANSGVNTFTPQFLDVARQLNDVEQRVMRLGSRYQELKATGTGTTAQFKKMAYEASVLSNQYDILRRRMLEMAQAGQAMRSGTITDEQRTSLVRSLNEEYSRIAPILSEVQVVTEGAAAATGSFAKQTLSFMLAREALRDIGKLFSKLGGYAKRLGKHLLNVTKNFLHLGKGAGKAKHPLKRLLRLITMYGFGFRTFYYLIRAIRREIKKSLSTMALYVDEVRDNIAGLKYEWTGFKAAFGPAIQPLLDIVIPGLRAIIAGATELTYKIAQLNAVLVGQDYYYRAVIADVQSFASAMNKLAHYDKLNTVQNNSSTLAGVLGYNKTELDDWAKELRENLKNNSLSNMLLTWAQPSQLNNVLNNILTKLNGWAANIDNFADSGTLGAIGNAVGDFLVKVFEFIPKSNLLHSISALIQRVQRALIDLMGREDVQQGFMDAAISILDSSEWDAVLSNHITILGKILKAAVGLLAEYARTGKLKAALVQLGTAVGEALDDMGWDNIVDAVWGGLKAAFSGLWAALTHSEVLEKAAAIALAAGFVKLAAKVIKIIALYKLKNKVLGQQTKATKTETDAVTDLSGAYGWGLVGAGLFGTALQGLNSLLDGQSDVIDRLSLGHEELCASVGASAAAYNALAEAAAKAAEAEKSMPEFDAEAYAAEQEARLEAERQRAELNRAWHEFNAQEAAKAAEAESVPELTAEQKAMVTGLKGIAWYVTAKNAIKDTVSEVGEGIAYVLGETGKLLLKIFGIGAAGGAAIPAFATGAVLPPNRPFLAQLGDQKHGTNVEAPLDTIKQAVAEVLAQTGGTNNPIVLQISGKTIAQVVWSEDEKRYKQTGR